MGSLPNMMWRIRWHGGLGLAGVCASLALAAEHPPAARTFPSTNAVVELRGRLVPVRPPVTHAAFRTESGDLYTLVSNRLSSALFIDTNLQRRTLLLGGRVLPATRTFEVTRNLRSIREGKIHELYYFCDICAIKGLEPGPCMCCRDDVHLVEEPVK